MLGQLQALSRGADSIEERHQWDTEAAQIAEAAIEAVEQGRPLPYLGKLSTRYQKQRKLIGAR